MRHNQAGARVFLALLAAGILWQAVPAGACITPVFRYALENWPADAYFVVIFHRGKLTADQQAVVDDLQDKEQAALVNLRLHLVDLAGSVEPRMQELWQRQTQKDLPRMVVTYPLMLPPMAFMQQDPQKLPLPPVLWATPLSDVAVQRLVDSPLRKVISRRLQAGETGIWVLVESGQDQADQKAAALLEAELKKLSATLELPDLDMPELYGPGPGAEAPPPGPELRVAFSLLRVKRDDPAEQLLVKMLLQAESDLGDPKYADQPMALLVFGRARVLYALVGAGINADNVAEACRLLVEPCSCTYKDELTGKGIDLLVTADWVAALEQPTVTEVVLPPVPLPPTAQPAPAKGLAGLTPVLRNALIAVAAVVILAGAFMVGVRLKKLRS